MTQWWQSPQQATSSGPWYVRCGRHTVLLQSEQAPQAIKRYAKRAYKVERLTMMRSLFHAFPAIAFIVGILGGTLASDAQSAPLIYVSQRTAASIAVIDVATNTITATIPVGSDPAGIAVNRSGTLGYVVNRGSNSVSFVDLTSNTVTMSVVVDPGPVALVLNPAETRLYVASRDSSTVSVLDARAGSTIATIPLLDRPRALVADPSGNKVYVLYEVAGTIAVIDTAANTISSNLNNRPDVLPLNFAITPSGTRLYVANWARRSGFDPPPGSTLVTVIDTTGIAPVVSIDVGDFVTDVTLAPRINRAFVATYSHVKVIDTSSDSVIASIPVTAGAGKVAFVSAANRIYVTNSYAHLVTVIDASTGSVLTTIPVVGNPIDIAVAPSAAPTSAEPIPTLSMSVLTLLALIVFSMGWMVKRVQAQRPTR